MQPITALAEAAAANTTTESAGTSLGTELKSARLASAFLDEPECLRRIPVSRRTWFEWRKKRGLPYIRVGHRVLYDWRSVHAWLLRQQRAVE
jgi:hypothetical protein